MTNDRALSGVRVIELGDYLSAPFLTSLLGDFGAEVIKLELPGHIDNSRMVGGDDPRDPERSPQFVGLGRNKMSATLDVRTDRGRELFLRIAAMSDVLVEDFRPGTLERWGVGPETLHARNAGLVLARISGYGQSGPLSPLGGVDHIGQAFGGIAGVTGFADGPPLRSGVPLADYTAGLLAALGIMLALRARDTGALGRGQVVDVSLYDAFLPMLGSNLANYSARGDAGGRSGNHWPGRTPNGCYRSSDGKWVMVDGVGDRLFRRLATATGHEEWLADPRFGTRADRSKHDAILERSIHEWVSDRTAADVVTRLEAHAVPVAIVASVEEVAANPHVRAREGVVEIDDEVYGPVLTPGPTPHLSATPGDIRAAAPRAGAHNDYLYRELLGLTPHEIDGLKRARAI